MVAAWLIEAAAAWEHTRRDREVTIVGVCVELTDRAVAVRFTGVDRWWALSSGIVLPTWRVLGARVLSRSAAIAACPARQLPGLGWPGVLRAGCYGIGQDRQLWLVHRAGSVLAIYLRGEPYHRVVIEVSDPENLSRDINNAIGQTSLRPGSPPPTS